jgi:hypothetical protein
MTALNEPTVTSETRPTMTFEPNSITSRRAMLVAALGGTAAFAAKTALAPAVALAGDGDSLRLGMSNFQSVTTSIQDTETYFDILALYSEQATALKGQSAYSHGVLATSVTNDAIVGQTAGASKSGVWGDNTKGGYGVSGSTGGSSAAGVWGDNKSSGQGVRGTSASGDGVRGKSHSGVGVRAQADSAGVALRVEGRAQFQRSGRATVTAGHSTVTVSMTGVRSTSYVLATVQANIADLAVRGVVPGTDKLTIYLTKSVASTVAVGFLVIN